MTRYAVGRVGEGFSLGRFTVEAQIDGTFDFLLAAIRGKSSEGQTTMCSSKEGLRP